MEFGLDTCSFRDKIAAKTEKITQEAEKESKQLRAGGDVRPCVPNSTAVVNTTVWPWWALPDHPSARWKGLRTMGENQTHEQAMLQIQHRAHEPLCYSTLLILFVAY